MNDTPNTIHWKTGDIVIHDKDAKCDHMLMRVIGYTRDGLCKTEYVEQTKRRTIYENEIKFLHDPNRPDIKARWRTCRPSST